MLDNNKLKAFMCVAKWKSFTKASTELFISQPALSKKISDFEKEIGTPLLIRDNRIIELTPAGKLLYTEAPAYLKIGDDLEVKVRQLGIRPGSQLSICCSGIEYGRIRNIMNRFHSCYPDISVVMYRRSASEIKRLLLTGMVDVVFQTHFEVEEEESVDFIPFSQDELAVVVSKDHALAQEEEISLEQLQQETYIGIQPQQDHLPFTRMINELCEKGFNPKEIRVVASIEELLLQVSCGLGVAHLIRQTETYNDAMVKYIPSKESTMQIQIDLVWHRSNQNPAAACFVDFVRQDNKECIPLR